MSVRSTVVVDTNVVLDMLVFGDARTSGLRNALELRRLAWLATTAMRDELVHVLRRGLGRRWPVEPGRIVADWDRLVRLSPQPPPARLLCSDADDQKFIDLALAHGPCWLLTRDKALLRLARRASAEDVGVLAPAHWNACLAQ